MYIRRADPAPFSNMFDTELVDGLMHIKAIHLTSKDAIEQAVLGGVGMMSFIVVASLLVYLSALVVRPGEGERKERARTLKKFLLSDMGVYFISLLLCDLGPAISVIGNVYWSSQFLIEHSSLCVLQGATNQFGVSGSAFWNLALAAQTFLLLVVRYTPPKWAKWAVLATGWSFATFMTILGPIMNKSSFSFFGPNASGCWLTVGSSHYASWFWGIAYMSFIVLFVMLVLYTGLFLCLSGALDELTGRVSSHTANSNGGKTASTAATKRSREVRKVARKMLWYPVSYGLLVIPLAVSVVMGARNVPISHTYVCVADMFWVFTGVADTLIFLLTRQHLLRPSSPSTHSTGDGAGGVTLSVITTTHAAPADEYIPPLPTLYHSSSLHSLRGGGGGRPPDIKIDRKGKGEFTEEEMRAADGEESPGTPKAFSHFVGAPVLGYEGGGRKKSLGRDKRGSGIERRAKEEGEGDSVGLVGGARERVVGFAGQDEHIPRTPVTPRSPFRREHS